MSKQNEKLIVYSVAGLAGYFFVLRPILVKLNILPDKQEANAAGDNLESLREQKTIFVPSTARTYTDSVLLSIINELYNATDNFKYDYEIAMRDIAYFSGFRNADALYFLKNFAIKKSMTLYQWYLKKFQNTTNFATVDWYPFVYEKYKANYANFGYTYSAFAASFDILFRKAVDYVYLVAKIEKN